MDNQLKPKPDPAMNGVGHILDEQLHSIIRKIKKASNNGKDEKAIGIINQIFLNEK